MSEGDEGYTPTVYFVGGGHSDVPGVTPATVGSKAYGLMRMDRAGLAVPPGTAFTVFHLLLAAKLVPEYKLLLPDAYAAGCI